MTLVVHLPHVQRRERLARAERAWRSSRDVALSRKKQALRARDPVARRGHLVVRETRCGRTCIFYAVRAIWRDVDGDRIATRFFAPERSVGLPEALQQLRHAHRCHHLARRWITLLQPPGMTKKQYACCLVDLLCVTLSRRRDVLLLLPGMIGRSLRGFSGSDKCVAALVESLVAMLA